MFHILMAVENEYLNASVFVGDYKCLKFPRVMLFVCRSGPSGCMSTNFCINIFKQ